jgi:hypothetical protein
VSGKSREEKLRLAKKIWLALLIVMLVNNTIAQNLLLFGQTPNSNGPNPFAMYIPELVPLGDLLSGVLFILGIIAYRKDYSYAIVLISAAALVAALLNYGTTQAFGGQPVLRVVPVTLYIFFVRWSSSGDTNIVFIGQDGQSTTANVGTVEIPANQETYFWIDIYTNPEVPPQDVRILWYIGDRLYLNETLGQLGATSLPFNWSIVLDNNNAGSNTIIVEVMYNDNGTLYYGYGDVIINVDVENGAFYNAVLYALLVASGAGIFALGIGLIQEYFTTSVADAINNFIQTPLIGQYIGNQDAYNFFLYFQNIAMSLGFVLLALGIGINALRGGYSDMVDLAMDFFYRSGVFLLFAYGGIQIYNAVASALNSIAEYIVSNVLGEIANLLTIWSELSFVLLLGSNAIGFGFARTIADLSMFMFEVDITIFALSYMRVVMILALASMIPLLAAMWTFEWTRGIATTLAEMLATLVFGGLVDALVLYFMVQVGQLAFFLLAPFMMMTFFMVGWGAHQAVKSIASGTASKAAGLASSMHNKAMSELKDRRKSNNNNSNNNNVSMQQVITSSQSGRSQNLPTVNTAINQLGQASTISLHSGAKSATITPTSNGYQITKSIKTSSGTTVVGRYTIPAKAPIQEVAKGVQKNFINKPTITEINPEIIGQFFQSIENMHNNNNNTNNENVRITDIRP